MSNEDGLLLNRLAIAGNVGGMKDLLTGDRCASIINWVSQSGHTALHWACLRGDARAVNLLVLKGADVRLSNPKTGSMPIDYAVQGQRKTTDEAKSAGFTAIFAILDPDNESGFRSEAAPATANTTQPSPAPPTSQVSSVAPQGTGVIEEEVEVWENQRLWPFTGYGDPGPLDRPARSDVYGRSFHDTELGAGWQWAGDWVIDRTHEGGLTGKDGWVYALNFPHRWHVKEGLTDCVRRRRLKRTLRYTPEPLPPLTEASLAQLPAAERKVALGERLFPLVSRVNPDNAPKITGMLLELDNAKLLALLASPADLARMVNESEKVLMMGR